MLSSRLIQLIEGHWNPITTQILQQIRHDPRLRHIGRLPESELRERAGNLVEHLGHWLTACKEQELMRRFENIGHQRHDEELPLHEVVLSYLIVKEHTLDFVRDQGLAQTTVELYAEEELEHCVSRFFDTVIYHVVRGYEVALHATRGRTATA